MLKFFKVFGLISVIILGGAQVSISAVQDTVAQQPDTTVIIGPVQVDTTQAEVEADTSVANEEEDEDPLAKFENLISTGVIIAVILALVVAYFVNQFIVLILDNLSEQFTSYRLGIKRLVPVVRLVIWAITIYIILAGIIDIKHHNYGVGIYRYCRWICRPGYSEKYIWRIYHYYGSSFPGGR